MPVLNQSLHMFALQVVHLKFAVAKFVELIGDETEESRPIRFGGFAQESRKNLKDRDKIGTFVASDPATTDAQPANRRVLHARR